MNGTNTTKELRETLKERGSRYGPFINLAKISQGLLKVMHGSPNWEKLDDDMKEALNISCNKLGRILNGDFTYHDSWHDIAGYITLVADRLSNDGK